MEKMALCSNCTCKKTAAQDLHTIAYNIRDIQEALDAAVSMLNIEGIEKYTAQLKPYMEAARKNDMDVNKLDQYLQV